MGLVIIIIALLLERYYNVGMILSRTKLFSAYARLVNPLLVLCNKVSPFLALFIWIFIPIFVLAMIYYLVVGHVLGALVFVFNLVVLVFCLGPDTLYAKWQAFCAAKADPDAQVSQQLYHDLAATQLESDQNPLVAGLLWQAYSGVFAVLFWFAILGWPVAVLYRLVERVAYLPVVEGQDNRLQPVALWVQQVLDWLPVRIMGLLYMLVGSFVHAFGVLFKYLPRGFAHNRALLLKVALTALSSDKIKEDDLGNTAILMIERSLIVWIVIIALLTVAQFF